MLESLTPSTSFLSFVSAHISGLASPVGQHTPLIPLMSIKGIGVDVALRRCVPDWSRVVALSVESLLSLGDS